jgi:hypothetical protein
VLVETAYLVLLIGTFLVIGALSVVFVVKRFANQR